jgi:prephenate dehydrogenase
MIPFDRVVIVGVGLIGGSWALALRRAGFAGPVIGLDPDPEALVALHAGAVDVLLPRGLEPRDARTGDLVVLAGPVGVITNLAATIAPTLAPGVVVTDVGSVKRAVCTAWAKHAVPGGGRFVGGHPMTGSHRSGFPAARADLFDGVPYFLSTSRTLADEEAARTRVAAAVAAIGARPVVVEMGAHDRDVAVTSHVPQLVSWALQAVVRDAGPELPGGPGLADMTRLAASDRLLWEDVLTANAEELVGPLTDLVDRLAAARDALAHRDPAGLASSLTPAGACDRTVAAI